MRRPGPARPASSSPQPSMVRGPSTGSSRSPGSTASLAGSGLLVVINNDGRGMTPPTGSPGIGVGLALIARLSSTGDRRRRRGYPTGDALRANPLSSGRKRPTILRPPDSRSHPAPNACARRVSGSSLSLRAWKAEARGGLRRPPTLDAATLSAAIAGRTRLDLHQRDDRSGRLKERGRRKPSPPHSPTDAGADRPEEWTIGGRPFQR
jgi:hypothetical protein